MFSCGEISFWGLGVDILTNQSIERWTTLGILFTLYGGPPPDSGGAIGKDYLAVLKHRAFRDTQENCVHTGLQEVF